MGGVRIGGEKNPDDVRRSSDDGDGGKGSREERGAHVARVAAAKMRYGIANLGANSGCPPGSLPPLTSSAVAGMRLDILLHLWQCLQGPWIVSRIFFLPSL